MAEDETPSAQAAIEVSVGDHPAGRGRLARPGYGLRMVALREAATLDVVRENANGPGVRSVIGTVEIPAVHVLECYGCSALFRLGSVGATLHTYAHRNAGARRAVRRAAYSAVTAAAKLTRKAD